MDYPVRTLSQLRPILQGFRKAAGLTQAAMASRLGVTQQTYAQLETNPAAVSVERLFRVLRVLDVDLTLAHTAASPSQRTSTPQPRAITRAAKSPKAAVARKTRSTSAAKRASAPKRASVSRKTENW